MRKTTIYEGRMIGLDIYNIIIQKRKVRREIITHPGVAAILAFDEEDKIILVKQPRFPRGYVLEIPAGNIDKNETSLACAKRELLEETGYRAKEIKHLIKFYPKLGYNSQIIDCYVATKLQKVASPNLDNDELITVKKIKFQKLLNLIKEGKSLASFTICAALTYELKKQIKN